MERTATLSIRWIYKLGLVGAILALALAGPARAGWNECGPGACDPSCPMHAAPAENDCCAETDGAPDCICEGGLDPLADVLAPKAAQTPEAPALPVLQPSHETDPGEAIGAAPVALACHDPPPDRPFDSPLGRAPPA
jgi:hypothetical protein